LEGLPELPPGAINALIDHDWPGNVRELENVVERALILASGSTLDFRTLLHGQVLDEVATPPEKKSQILVLDQLVRNHISSVLKTANGKIYGPGGAACLLGINANTLRNRMNKLGIPCKRRNRLSI
jgi:hydrogenase-4 transcriptional activator